MWLLYEYIVYPILYNRTTPWEILGIINMVLWGGIGMDGIEGNRWLVLCEDFFIQPNIFWQMSHSNYARSHRSHNTSTYVRSDYTSPLYLGPPPSHFAQTLLLACDSSLCSGTQNTISIDSNVDVVSAEKNNYEDSKEYSNEPAFEEISSDSFNNSSCT